MFREKEYRPRAKRHPLVPVVLRNAVFGPLVDEDGHDAEPVVGLKDYLPRDQKLSRVVDKQRWVGRDRRAVSRITEVTGRSGSVLERKHVIAAVPLQALMAETKRVSVCGGNVCAGGKRRAILNRTAL